MPSTTIVHHPLNKLARSAVETYIREHRVLAAPMHSSDEPHSGVFVSLLLNHELRGSVGTLRPTQPTLAAEVITNAIGAAVRDPRFTPVQPLELLEIKYVVDLITDFEPLKLLGSQNPVTKGLAVCADHRWGVVLPGVLLVRDAIEQRTLALKKAHIHPAEPYQQYTFCVRRFT